jgi:two-component system LytT family sensor kinase
MDFRIVLLLNRITAPMQKPKHLKSSFWLFQVTGWTVFALIILLRITIQDLGGKSAPVSTGNDFLAYFLYCLAGMILTWIIRYFYRYIYSKQYPFIIIICIIVVSTFFISVFHLFTISKLINLIEGVPDKVDIFQFLVSLIWNLPIFFGWSVIYFGIKTWRQSMADKEQLARANYLAQSAQLQMLRYQLNPHFLFNSLNSIWALIDEDKKASKEMVSELAEFLRYSLTSKNYSDVPLRQEIEAIRHYFSIEKKRFEEKLEVEFDIDPEAEDFPVLSFILNPLVENAIKYGMRTSTLPLRIAISAKVKNHSLTLQVTNTGKWITPLETEAGSGTGMGLQNIRLRLDNAFPGKSNFEIGQFEDKVVATIVIHDRS